jgi:hypothetical protein
VGDRIVVNGIDLGAAWLAGGPLGESFLVVYYRHPYAFGARFCCDGDDDSILRVWLLDDATSTADEFGEFGGVLALPSDINSKGQFVGGHPANELKAFYAGTPSGAVEITSLAIENLDSLQNHYWLTDSEMLRINEYGQALGYVYFDADTCCSGWRLFVLSPVGAPAPVPEPSTLVLFPAGVATIAWLRTCLAFRYKKA